MAGNMMCEQHPPPRSQKLSQMTLTAESVESVGVGPRCAIPLKFGVRMDVAHFFRSNEGFLKLLQLAIGVACVACATPALGTYNLPAGSYWFIAATVFSVVLTFLWVLIYLLCLKERARKFPWNFFTLICFYCNVFRKRCW
ncbi:Hypothetical predicted protein [Cloeon dipterum]|uniref:MARVEL domain-containing protein n=1 Tax=Cloeon dipterum TaxID=197152 RepID=A0A8S1DW07_9INSE|nr:Hypothetical predicted protein [Cloeon dipterum]